MTVASGVSVTLHERTYRVAGTNTHHLMAAATMMCPQRAGAGHVGYTDWEMGWSFASCEDGGRHVVGAARVEVVVTRTLPRWRPLAAASCGRPQAQIELGRARRTATRSVATSGPVPARARARRSLRRAAPAPCLRARRLRRWPWSRTHARSPSRRGRGCASLAPG